MGRVFRRGVTGKGKEKYKDPVWYIEFYAADGKQRRKRVGTEKEGWTEGRARRELRKYEGQVVEDRFSGFKVERVKYTELADDLLNDYTMRQKKSIDRLKRSLKHLHRYFARFKAKDITTDRVRLYIIKRQKEGAFNATINRELSALKRMFNLTREMTPPKVALTPYIPHLEENNVRSGYFEHSEFMALRAALPEYVRPIVTTAYYTGMRKMEILSLRWDQVNLLEGKITLKPEDTKNREPRTIYIEGDVLEAIQFQKAQRDELYPETEHVFFGKTGKRVKDFRGAWFRALRETGLDGKIFHDFRRTAVRNLVRAGVPERVAMTISGHKTRSVFERYNIVNEDDLRKAALKVSEHHATAAAEGAVINTGEQVTEEEGERVVH